MILKILTPHYNLTLDYAFDLTLQRTCHSLNHTKTFLQCMRTLSTEPWSPYASLRIVPYRRQSLWYRESHHLHLHLRTTDVTVKGVHPILHLSHSPFGMLYLLLLNQSWQLLVYHRSHADWTICQTSFQLLLLMVSEWVKELYFCIILFNKGHLLLLISTS